MGRLSLPSGKSVLIEVRHFMKTVRRRNKNQLQRATRIRVTKDTLECFTGESVCSLNDQFCRGVGRAIAVKRLLNTEQVRKEFSKEDCSAIFHTICPVVKKSMAIALKGSSYRNLYTIKLRKKPRLDDERALHEEEMQNQELLRKEFGPPRPPHLDVGGDMGDEDEFDTDLEPEATPKHAKGPRPVMQQRWEKWEKNKRPNGPQLAETMPGDI